MSPTRAQQHELLLSGIDTLLPGAGASECGEDALVSDAFAGAGAGASVGGGIAFKIGNGKHVCWFANNKAN